MSSVLQPAPGASLACDTCGQTRVWARWNSKTGTVVCATCIAGKGHPRNSGGMMSHSAWQSPTDATKVPTPEQIQTLMN